MVSPQLLLAERYQFIESLGKRSAGRQTLLARDIQTQALVVIKLLTFPHDFEWEALKRFEREAHILKFLDHPKIPQYLDFFELQSPDLKGFGLVQTYLPARSLASWCEQGRTLSEPELKALAKDVLEILIYLHDRQPTVIHRDIKPSNLLLGERSGNHLGEVYLVDFGSVQNLATTQGGTITIVGTYGYMPPEQFGDRAVPASDLYSLGATLIYVATGQHPADLPQTNLKIQFRAQAHLSDTFADWLEWMTQPSLDCRPYSAQQALEALENGLQLPTHQIPIVWRKPAGSQIRLTTTVNTLDLVSHSIRVGNWQSSNLKNRFFTVCILLLLSGFILSVLSLIVSPALSPSWDYFFWQWILNTILFRIPIYASLLLLFWPVVRRLRFYLPLRRLRLLIRDKISLTSELWGLKYHFFKPVGKDEALIIQILKRDPSLSMMNAQHGYPELVLWVGTQRISIGGDGLLSEPEIEWLAQELSQCLGVPIVH